MRNLIILLLTLFIATTVFGQSKDDEKAIDNIVQEMAEGWSNADGAIFAKHFAEEHDYFVWNGLYHKNMSKEQNAYGHQSLFDKEYKNTTHYAVLDKVRFITENVAVALVTAAVVSKGESMPEHPQVLWSGTLLKENGIWKIVSFHNADIEILDNAVSRANSPIPIESMYKKWYDTYNQLQ